MKNRVLSLIALLFVLVACGERENPDQPARILAMGDSLLASHSAAKASISYRVEAYLGEPVIDRSVSGARMINNLPVSSALGMRISQQFMPGDWDWIILNGGGNDLWMACGCIACDTRIDRMIAPDGSDGKIADLVSELRSTGARVIYVGYLRSPGRGSPIEHCRDEGDKLEERIARMAEDRDGVYFLSLRDLVPYGDGSYHAADMIHPSQKASNAIAAKIAKIISDAS
ncbi:MAG: SGNH/GDSL hydrolase family protein [Aestuariivita sp.]|uniref:SGNH/GDSL hydrolase family protein n=1 Tax=Aestuariivita sp. TaxID=1872407 RepID=UPI003BB1BDB9